MRKKVLVVQVFVLVLATILMLGSVTYAWFSKFERTSIIDINTASLKVEAHLYHAGTSPDNEYELVEHALVFDKILPGDEFHFKLIVKNTGTIDGHLLVEALNIQLTDGLDNIFEFEFEDETQPIDTEDGNVLFQNIKLTPSEEKELEFKIITSGGLSSVSGQVLTIERMKITLDQIR